MQADCLERLVGVAQRAPRVRRLSWSFLGAKKNVWEMGRWWENRWENGDLMLI
jgi:hypothetical protein